jgi:hypothetical protein
MARGAAVGIPANSQSANQFNRGGIAWLFKKCDKKRKNGRQEFVFISPRPTPSGFGCNYTSCDVGVGGFTLCVNRPHAVGDMFAFLQTGLAVLRYSR